METIMKTIPTNALHDDSHLLHLLDSGIDDMENGRELPLKEAFNKINELRTSNNHAKL